MAYIPRSSFIPKEASGVIPVQMRKRRTIHIFSLIATLMLVVTILGAVGSFFYVNFLEAQLVEAKKGLGDVSKQDNEKKIEEIRQYDTTLVIARGLLDNHIATSKLFEVIEDATKETVQFTTLEYTYDPGFEATLVLTGDTEKFTSVALQKMQFLKETLFSEYVVKDITTKSSDETDEEVATGNEGGENTLGVGFSVTGVFKNGILSYTGVEEAEISLAIATSTPIIDTTATTSTSTSIVATSTGNVSTP